MAYDQHLDDIVIPDIEISEGWPISDLGSTEDCNDAFAFLMAAVASIELQIELEAIKPLNEQRPDWAARARYALKMKKAALQLVGYKRGVFGKEEDRILNRTRDRVLLEYIRTNTTNAQFMNWLAASGATEFQNVA